MAKTYDPIATTTLGSSTASYTFSSSPQTYTDLVLIINGTASAANGVKFRVNGLSSSIYGCNVLYGNGSIAGSYRAGTAGAYNTYGSSLPTSNNGTIVSHFFNYTNTTNFKGTLSRANPVSGEVSLAASVSATNDAITSITSLFDTSATFSAGTTFTLYGIKGA